MLVSICVAGRESISVEVPGSPLLSKLAPFKAKQASHGWVLDYVPRDGVDKICGFLNVVTVDPSGRTTTTPVWIPPPPPFTNEEVVAMWRDVLDADLGLPSDISLQGQLDGFSGTKRSKLGERRRDDLLPELLAFARQMLVNWPQYAVPDRVWRPVGSPGGVEEPIATLKNGWIAGVGERNHRTAITLPALSARRSVKSANIKHRTLARLLQRVCGILESEYEPTKSVDVLRSHIQMVASKARPENHSHVDLAPSSWPTIIRGFAESAWRFIETRSATGSDSDRPVPLCEVWRLYERWIAVKTLRSVTDRLGDPSCVKALSLTGERWLAQWLANDWNVTLESQYTFGDKVGVGLTWRSHFRSVTTRLIPDVCLVVESMGANPSVLLIDAKERSESYGQDQASAEAAKYLWGIRDANMEHTNRVQVVLATSRDVESAYFPSESRMAFVQTTPDKSADLTLRITRFLESSTST